MFAKTESLGYALLIGVDDYSTYDASVHASPEATSSLRGSVNDVRAWYRLCRELGYPAENIRVLASPEIARPDLEGATVGPATDSAIREGVGWLAEKLGAPNRPGGVLMFSGHGSMTAKGLVLCPTNVKASGDDLENTVSLVELQATIAARDAGRNLTVALDCCHSGDGTRDGGQRKATTLHARAQASGQPITVPAIGDHMFFASRLGTAAYQAELDGRWHGAFTWAFMTVQDQWTIVENPSGSRELTISYEEMRARTEALLAALSFDQKPALRCAPDAATLPVFHRGPAKVGDETSIMPDGDRRTKQLDPGQKGYRVYTLYDYTSSTVPVGQILVPNTGATYGSLSYSPGTEYWYLSRNINTSSYYLHLTWADYDWSTSAPSMGTLSFTMVQNATWSYYGSTAPSSSSTLYVVNGMIPASVAWGLSYSITSTPPWSGALTWYSTTAQNTVFGGTTTTSVYLYNNTSPSVTWSYTSVAPQ